MTTSTSTTKPVIGHCVKCHRPLRNASPDGLGPKCRRYVRRNATALDGFKPAQVDAARELIEDGGIIPVRTVRVGTVYRTVATDGTETYLTTAAGHCTCPAGHRSARCYHVAAALSLAA